MVELLVVFAVLLTALQILITTTISFSKLRASNFENSLASEAARSALEAMRNEPFEFVWALYNRDPTDDPAGPGTASGAGFTIPGLVARDDDPDGLPGEIVLPAMSPDEQAELGQIPDGWQLREDFVDPRMGMPRDLNGNGVVETTDRGGDYVVLPVLIRVQWQGRFGPRELEVYTIFSDFEE